MTMRSDADGPSPPPLTDEDRAYLATYDPRAFPPVAVTVDIVILTIQPGGAVGGRATDAGELSVLLVRRGSPPYRGLWALPGGFAHEDEDLDVAAARELHEETGILGTAPNAHLEQLATYGRPGRDPRLRVVSVAYLALVADLAAPVAGDDAAEARLWPVPALAEGRPTLAFDHTRIIEDAVERARSKLEYTSLATSLLPEPFTIGDLRRVYEAVWGMPLHPANFRRKVLATPGFVVPAGQRASTGRGWSELYRRGTITALHPALPRPSQLTTDEADGPDTL